jgi:hypothetical protein
MSHFGCLELVVSFIIGASSGVMISQRHICNYLAATSLSSLFLFILFIIKVNPFTNRMDLFHSVISNACAFFGAILLFLYSRQEAPDPQLANTAATLAMMVSVFNVLKSITDFVSYTRRTRHMFGVEAKRKLKESKDRHREAIRRAKLGRNAGPQPSCLEDELGDGRDGWSGDPTQMYLDLELPPPRAPFSSACCRSPNTGLELHDGPSHSTILMEVVSAPVAAPDPCEPAAPVLVPLVRFAAPPKVDLLNRRLLQSLSRSDATMNLQEDADVVTGDDIEFWMGVEHATQHDANWFAAGIVRDAFLAGDGEGREQQHSEDATRGIPRIAFDVSGHRPPAAAVGSEHRYEVPDHVMDML